MLHLLKLLSTRRNLACYFSALEVCVRPLIICFLKKKARLKGKKKMYNMVRNECKQVTRFEQ